MSRALFVGLVSDHEKYRLVLDGHLEDCGGIVLRWINLGMHAQ